MKVQVNDCFEPLTEFSVVPGFVRVLYLNERYDAVVLIQLTDPPRQPIGLGLEELRGSVIAGDTKLAKVVTPEFLLVLEDDLDEKKKRERDEKWNIIAPLIDSGYPGQIFAPGEMGQMVGARAVELGIQRKSIYRLLYRYWINGQVRNALLKNYAGVGVPERKYDPAKPPGRKPRYQGIAVSPTKVIDAVDKRCIRIGYSLFVGDKTSTITNAYVEMLRRFYTAKDLSKNPESGGRLLPESEIPSFREGLK